MANGGFGSNLSGASPASAGLEPPIARFKRLRVYFAAAAFFLLIAGLVFYRLVVLKEEISEFELEPKIADAAGVSPATTFILKSTADLSAAVIAKHLRIEPAVDFKVKKIGSGSAVFEIAPSAALGEDKIYSLAIAEGPIAARGYGWAFQVKAPFQVISSLPRDKGSEVPVNTGVEITFNRENLIGPEKYFEASPETPGRFEVRGSTLVFIPLGELEPRTIYTLRIKPGLKAEGSSDTLAEAKEIRFETADRYDRARPYLHFGKMFWEFKPDTEPIFEVSANLPSVRVIAYKFASAEEFIRAYLDAVVEENNWSSYNRYTPYIPPPEKKIFESGADIENQANVNFLRVPAKLGEGYYLADVVYGENQREQTWFQMNPMASFLGLSEKKSIIWLKDLSNRANIAGAEVRFGGGLVGRTGDDGAVVFDTPQKLIRDPEGQERYYYSSLTTDFFIVAHGGKELAVPVETNYGYFYKLSPPDSWWDYLAIDKTVYLPTDTLRFWGVVKRRNGEDVRGEELSIQLTKPFWGSVSREEITALAETKSRVGDFHTVSGELKFSSLNPGLYNLVVLRGKEMIVSESVNIETYIKPAYRIEIEPEQKAVFAGDQIKYRVRAEFFDGTPVSNLALEYRGYYSGEVNGRVNLDRDGRGEFSVNTAYSSGVYDYWPRYFGMNVSPAAAEEGDIDANVSVLVFGPKSKLQSEQSIAEKTSTFNLKLRNVVLDRVRKGEPWWDDENYLGSAVANWVIEADVTEIIHRQTETSRSYDPVNKITYPIYSYWQEKKPVRRDILSTDANGQAKYQWTAEAGKTYAVTFKAQDSGGRETAVQHYVYGGLFSYFGYYSAEGIRLKNIENKSEYRLGDTVRLEIEDNAGAALAPSPSNFLFVRTTNGVITNRASDSSYFSDRFDGSYIPNASFVGVWFGGARFHSTHPLHVSFDADERRLNIEVKKDKERYRPRDKATLAIRVTDKDGRPKRAEVNLTALDQAVFVLNPQEKDVVSDLYRDIYSSLVVRSSHYSTPLVGGAEKGGCFVAGTQVSTPTGPKNIENLRAGDEVLTRESENSPRLVHAKTRRASAHLVDGYVIINDRLKITKNHALWVNGFWSKAGEINVGDKILLENGEAQKVRTLAYQKEWLTVYNIELDKHHTFFANGVYVHNEEKGGGVDARADFRDIAVFRSVVTGADGRGEVSFDLPDNLTSWRITAQAVTDDLFAGKTIEFAPVGLPFFVDATLNRTYLAGDDLVLRLRTFGTENELYNARFTVESDTLPFKKIEATGERVTDIALGRLTAGKHKIKITAESGERSDAILREIDVLSSYFTKNASEFYELSPALGGVKSSAKGLTALVFSSLERGKFYNMLRTVSCDCGERIDQKIASRLADGYLNRFFGERRETDVLPARRYQTPQGGIALLPYSDDDLELSAKFAVLTRGEDADFDREALKKYLRASLADKRTDLKRVARVLYGLSAFGEPVLISLQNIKSQKTLDFSDKVYIALTLDALGAKEEARRFYAKEIKPALEKKGQYVYVGGIKNRDEQIITTALLAGLAASLSENEADGLSRYAFDESPAETLKNFELLLYARSALPQLKAGDVSFSYETTKDRFSKTLKKGETFRLELPAEDIAALKFGDVNGRVGLVSIYEKESSPEDVKKDAAISIRRSYSAAGRGSTNEFEGTDLVRIDFAAGFSAGSFSGPYQVMDYLPSGLRPMTSYGRAPYGSGRYYPSDIADQKVTFVVSKNFPSFYYYARAVSKGSYKAEPALIQSLRNLESMNLSEGETLTIR